MDHNSAADEKKQRSVLSYALRQGRMSHAQTYALNNLWPVYGIECKNTPIPLSSFDLRQPLIAEIGFGMGHSLVSQAKSHPACDFIGIEVHKPGVGSLLLQLEKEKIPNVRVICHDAVEVLKYCLPHHCLDKIQIFFPDPWPKRKHHKRRLIQTDFVKLLHQKLKSGGLLHLATDWRDYADYMQKVLLDSNLFKKNIEIKALADRPLTKYEVRGKKSGHSIWEGFFKAESLNNKTKHI